MSERRGRGRSTCLVLLLALCGSPAGAAGDGQAKLHPKHRLVYQNLLVARVNPLGLEDRITLGYRYRLYSRPGLLWRDAYLGLALTPKLNPAAERIGGTLTIKPLAVLMLQASYYFVGWTGGFEYLQSFNSPRAEHSDSQLDVGKDAGRNYSTTGTELQLRAQLLAKVGPIVLRNDLKFYRGSMSLENQGDRLYYEPNVDLLLPNNGWSLTNDIDLVWLSGFGLVAGVRTTITHAFYRDADFQAGESTDDPNGPTVRLGPLLAYVFYDKPERRYFNKPTVLVIFNWFARHRYRTGADVSRGIPYFVVGFKFEGELWRR